MLPLTQSLDVRTSMPANATASLTKRTQTVPTASTLSSLLLSTKLPSRVARPVHPIHPRLTVATVANSAAAVLPATLTPAPALAIPDLPVAATAEGAEVTKTYYLVQRRPKDGSEKSWSVQCDPPYGSVHGAQQMVAILDAHDSKDDHRYVPVEVELD